MSDGGTGRTVSAADIARALDALASGQVIAIPTDTVYGLAASLDHPDAIERLYEIKGREGAKAIPVLVDTLDCLAHLDEREHDLARALAGAFWPGALTLVVTSPDSIPDVIHRGSGTVGFRMPDHAIARAVIKDAGGALAVTSANRSGEPEALTAMEVRDALGDAVPVVIDAGRTPGGRASTVVDLTSGELRILRAGDISLADIERAVHRGGAEE